MPQYIPPNYVHFDRQADVRYVAARPAPKKGPGGSPFVDIGLGGGSSSDRPPFKSVQVSAISAPEYDHFPMTYMQLPAPGWWTLARLQFPYLHNYELRLAPKNDQSTVLTFACGGVPYAEEYPLVAIMKKTPHILTNDERESLKIKDHSSKKYTEMLNGKLVYCSEWTNKTEMGYRIEFNHNPDSSPDFFSSEITFIAKPAQYKRYINQIKACLKTIKWNDKVTMLQ